MAKKNNKQSQRPATGLKPYCLQMLERIEIDAVSRGVLTIDELQSKTSKDKTDGLTRNKDRRPSWKKKTHVR